MRLIIHKVLECSRVLHWMATASCIGRPAGVSVWPVYHAFQPASHRSVQQW